MINMWHSLHAMKKHSLEWHLHDLDDELREYDEPQSMLKKWSELSDIVYTCTRGKWSGRSIVFPFSRWMFFLGAIYMYPVNIPVAGCFFEERVKNELQNYYP